MGWRAGLVLFGIALGVRAAFVAWAPVVPSGDAFFYDMHGRYLAAGAGYVNADGSPAIWWVPGWPLVLAGIYALFGRSFGVVAALNASFGALTTVLVASLATRFFGRRGGLAAGAVYALWPGLIFFHATLYSESLFLLLLAGALRLFVAAGDARRARLPAFAAAGALFGLCSLVKAEPLVLAPALLLFVWTASPSRAAFARASAASFLAAACVLAPWVVRNQVVFDRFIPTSASGGLMAYLGHHEGSRGGNDYRASRDFLARHQGGTFAESCLRQNAAGWREAWQFVRAHPREELRIQLRKLALAYGNDSEGAKLVRGLGPRVRGQVSPAAYQRMRRAADLYWFAVAALSLVGLSTLRRWPAPARALLLGVVVCWFAVHVVFVGGSRYRAPESLAYAVFAGVGLDRLAELARRRRSG